MKLQSSHRYQQINIRRIITGQMSFLSTVSQLWRQTNTLPDGYEPFLAIFQVDLVSRYQNVSILDFIEAKDDGSVQSSSQIITNNKPTPAVTVRVSFLSPNQQCQSTEDKANSKKTATQMHKAW